MKSEAIPRLRFEGFNNKWNISRIDDIAKYKNGKALEKYSNNKGNKGSLIIINLSSITDKGFLKDSKKRLIKSNTITTLNKNDLVMILSEQAPGLIGITAIIPQNNKFVLNQRVGLLRLNHPECSQCVHYLINMKQRHFERISGGTKQLNLSKKDILRTKLYLPSLSEQRAIGKFFAKLDKLIQLQQKKVALLKKLKRGYLQKLFPRKGESVPRLRFKGFHDKWCYIKLGNISKWMRGKGLPKDTLNVKGLGSPVIHYADLYKFPTVQNRTIHWSVKKGGVMIPSKVLLFPMSDVTPTGLANATAFNAKNVRASGDMLIDKISSNYDINYLAYFLNSHPYKIIRLVEGTTVRHIHAKDLSTIELPLPFIKEQRLIGQLFLKLDKLIQSHQKEINSLRKLKKAYLQKMFC